MRSIFHISCLQDELTFLLEGPLTFTLKCKFLQRKRETICITVTTDNVENKWILDLNVRSIDNHFEELETLIESFGVNKTTLVCCSETWMADSSTEDLYVLDNFAPMKFPPGKTRNEGVAIYVHESLSFETIEIDIRIDLNYIAFSCTNLKEKFISFCLYNPFGQWTILLGAIRSSAGKLLSDEQLFFCWWHEYRSTWNFCDCSKYLTSLKLNGWIKV